MISSNESCAWPGQNVPEWLWCEKGMFVRDCARNEPPCLLRTSTGRCMSGKVCRCQLCQSDRLLYQSLILEDHLSNSLHMTKCYLCDLAKGLAIELSCHRVGGDSKKLPPRRRINLARSTSVEHHIKHRIFYVLSTMHDAHRQPSDVNEHNIDYIEYLLEYFVNGLESAIVIETSSVTKP